MPIMDGFEATKSIRILEQESTKKAWIVGLSGHSTEAFRRKAMEVGMEEFLSKPMSVEQLKQVLDKIVII